MRTKMGNAQFGSSRNLHFPPALRQTSLWDTNWPGQDCRNSQISFSSASIRCSTDTNRTIQSILFSRFRAKRLIASSQERTENPARSEYGARLACVPILFSELASDGLIAAMASPGIWLREEIMLPVANLLRAHSRVPNATRHEPPPLHNQKSGWAGFAGKSAALTPAR